MTDKKMKIEFAPGCFDNFDGTQEELDEFIAEITAMAESGGIMEDATAVNMAQLFEEDPALAIKIAGQIGLLDDLYDDDGNEITSEQIQEVMDSERKRKLH
jgi:hypothetical protein